MFLSFIGTAHAAGTPAAHDAPKAFPPFDSATFGGQLFWLALFFVLLYILMSKLALPRVGQILEDRRARIAADLATAANAQKSAEEAGKAYEQGLSKAKANAQSIAQAARDAAAKESDTRRHQVESDLNSKLMAAEKSIGETKAKAMANVEGIATDAAAAIIERLSGVAPQGKSVVDAIAALLRK